MKAYLEDLNEIALELFDKEFESLNKQQKRECYKAFGEAVLIRANKNVRLV